MKKLLFASAFLLLWLSPNKAQPALSYTRMDVRHSSWNQRAESLNETRPFGIFNGLSLGFWFRLKSYRWEFLPELQGTFMQAASGSGYTYEGAVYSFRLHNRIYPFDFLNDCNCPTFSKQNTFFKRGFFLEFSPEISLPTLQYSDEIPGKEIQSAKPSLGFNAGMGLDIGLSDSFTLSPLLRFRYLRIQGLPEPASLLPYRLQPETAPQPTDSWNGVEVGLQLLWRYKK